MIRKTISTDLAKIYGTNNSVFTGVDDQVNLYLDPIVTGYGFIYWVQLPSWFEQDDDLKYFRQFSQKNFRSFNGIGSLELQTVENQTGFAAHDISVVTGIQRQNTEFQIGHKEYSGSPMTKMYRKWISLIRDPRTNLAVYPKLYNIEYGARNHSGQLLYIMTRPDATNTGHNTVEFAQFYSNVVPTNVPNDSLYNFEIGNQDSPEIEITFKGFPEMGPNVDKFAQKILDERIMTSSGDAYLPFVDMYNTNTEASSFVEWGTDDSPLKQIFTETEKIG